MSEIINKSTALARLDKISKAIAGIKTIGDAVGLRDKMEVLRYVAKEAGLGLQVQNEMCEKKIEIECIAGRMLIDMKERGERDRGMGGDRKSPLHRVTVIPKKTLFDLGIRRIECTRWSGMAQLPQEIKSGIVAKKKTDKKEVTSAAIYSAARTYLKNAKWEKKKKEIGSVDKNILIGRFQDQAKNIKDGSISLILTDPPYDKKAADQFPDLAKFAEDKLIEGGSIVFYCGHLQLPRVFESFRDHLRLWWVFACLNNGPKPLLDKSGIRVHWKPMPWFVKGTRLNTENIVGDLISVGEKEKEDHAWQQSEKEAEYLIAKLCPPGGIVLDPYAGTGTTVVAAKKLGHPWIAIEEDREKLDVIQKRINDVSEITAT